MKRPVLLIATLFLVSACFAQGNRNEYFKSLRQKEDTLKVYADKIIQSFKPFERFNADSIFIKMFVRALKTPYSFSYPFDSVHISKLYAPDSSFRIFSWQMVVNENMVRQRGAIQMKTSDGTLKLFPLIDKSDITTNISDTSGDSKSWIGAVYYKIVETKNGNQSIYTLLGYDENNIRSNKKIVEVLSFSNDQPTFGGRFFSFEEDSIPRPSTSRYIIEYKKDAGARLTYDADLKMIVAEHLESESNQPEKKWTYIPDGDYEGFKWKNGKWIHVAKIFTQVTAEGAEPVPSPVKDAAGNTMEEKLKDNIGEEKIKVEEMPSTVKPVAKPKVTKKPKQ